MLHSSHPAAGLCVGGRSGAFSSPAPLAHFVLKVQTGCPSVSGSTIPPPHPPPHACCPCRPNAGSTSVTLPSSRCQGSRTHNLGCSSAPSTSLLPSLPFLSLPPPFLPSSFPPPPYLLSSLPLLSLSFPSPSSPLSLPLPPSVSSHSAFSQHPPPAPTHRAQAHHPLPLVCPWPCTSHLVTNPITDVRPRSPSARTQAQGPLRLVLTAHGG